MSRQLTVLCEPFICRTGRRIVHETTVNFHRETETDMPVVQMPASHGRKKDTGPLEFGLQDNVRHVRRYTTVRCWH